MISFNLLCVLFSSEQDIRGKFVLISKVAICIYSSNRKRSEQSKEFIQILVLSCSKGKRQRCVGGMVNSPPEPYLVGLIMIITPHFVHFCPYRADFNIYSRIFFQTLQAPFIDLLYKFSCFFNTDVTVLGEIFKTRPVSLVPDPFITISTILSFMPGRLA